MRAALPHTTGTVDRDGVNLHYEIYGKGDRAILFVPTWSLIHSRSWKAQVPYFSEYFRVIIYDPRGNGQSGRPNDPDSYAVDHFIADAVAVMDATDTASATLVGHSFSSAIAFAVAADHSERVDAIVSTCGWSPIVPPYPHRAAAYAANPPDRPEGWQKYNATYWLRNYPDFAEFFLGKVHSEPHSTKQHEDAVAWALEGDGEMLKMTQDARDGTVAINEAMYRRVRCPCLFVYGESDEVTPPETSIRIAELTGGELHAMPGGGHGVHARFPAWFNTLMRD